jgi:hypothetical protein
MKIDTLDHALVLADDALLARLQTLAGSERAASAELVAHLAALDARPAVYAAAGYGSLFGYCTGALRLSEDAACNRIAAAQAVRRFPRILDLLASGALSLTSVRLLRKHLTAENHEGVLARASGRSRPQLEKLVAELAPRPDVASTVRKLPRPAAASAPATERPASTAPPMTTTASLTPPPPSHRRSSSRSRPSATASSSRSARARRRSSGASRRCCAGRFRTAIPPSSSIAR